jgi:hypothetical protein
MKYFLLKRNPPYQVTRFSFMLGNITPYSILRAIYPTNTAIASHVLDQDSVHSVQQHSPAETRKGQTIVAAAEQTLPTNIGQQHTRNIRDDPNSYFMPAKEPSDAQSVRPDEVVLAEQKFASSGN